MTFESRRAAASGAKAKATRAARSAAQIAASKRNGAKSRGPTTPEGRKISRFNRLQHGLRAEQAVLPGEDPAEFQAIRDAYYDEWDPETLTRAMLVERLAINSWRLFRATRADIAYRAVTADGSAYAADADRRRRVDRALEWLLEEPTAALADLESHAHGIDRLLTSWSELEASLAGGPSGWDRPFHHHRLMMLHGRHDSLDPALIGPSGRASAKLLAANTPGGTPLPAEEAEAAAEEIRRVVVANLERLRGLRTRVQDPEEQRRQMIDAAMVDETAGAQLRIRYEMAIERSIRSTIKQLMELKRTGADLNEPEIAPVEAPADPEPEPADPEPAPEGSGARACACVCSVGAGFVRRRRRRRRLAAGAAPSRPAETGP